MSMLARAVVALVGVLALVVAIAFWINPVAPAARLGIAAQDALGMATLRADLGGFFAGAGVLSIFAAVRNRAQLLTAPLILIALALSARVASAILLGLAPNMIQPMVIEAVLLVVLGLSRQALPKG